MCTSIYVYYYYLLLLLLLIIKAQSLQYLIDDAFSIYFYLFIYFGHLYIDHHLVNIARIGTALVKARGDRRDHR